MREFVRDLEGAQHAAREQLVRLQPGHILAVEQDVPGGRRKGAGDHVEQRRLAGAVRPDQPGDRAALDLQRAAVDREHIAKTLGDLPYVYRRRHDALMPPKGVAAPRAATGFRMPLVILLSLLAV